MTRFLSNISGQSLKGVYSPFRTRQPLFNRTVVWRYGKLKTKKYLIASMLFNIFSIGSGFFVQNTIQSTLSGDNTTRPNLSGFRMPGTKTYPARRRFINHSEYNAGISVLRLALMIIRLIAPFSHSLLYGGLSYPAVSEKIIFSATPQHARQALG